MYFYLHIEYRPLDPGDTTQVNLIEGVAKPQGIGTIFLELEDNTGKIHKLKFENIYYFPVSPNLLISPQKWASDRGGEKVSRYGTYHKEMDKRSVLVWNNRTSLQTIFHERGVIIRLMFNGYPCNI